MSNPSRLESEIDAIILSVKYSEKGGIADQHAKKRLLELLQDAQRETLRHVIYGGASWHKPGYEHVKKGSAKLRAQIMLAELGEEQHPKDDKQDGGE